MFGRDRRENTFEIEEQIIAICISRDGRPAATLTWFLDEEPIYEGLSQPDIAESTLPGNQSLFSIRQNLTRYIRADDDRKVLVCRASHVAGSPQDARHQLQVRCKYILDMLPSFWI